MDTKFWPYIIRCPNRRLKKHVVCLVFGMCLVTAMYLVQTHNGWIMDKIFQLHSQQCTEIQNIVFLKVHKTGSSTVANILQRFGYFRNLNFALPNKTAGQLRYNYFGGVGETLKPGGTIPSKPKSKQYNILYNHVIFNWKPFLKIFPKNTTVYVTTLRQPVNQFLSSLLFFLHEEILDAAKENITFYLKNPEKFEPEESPYLSFTNNRQALDLGLPPSKVRDKTYITRYINMLDKVFDLVLIMEYFDESLILLKRRMCWNFKDILHIRKNKAYQSFDFQLSFNDKTLLKDWALADHLIYEHFYKKFHIILKREPNVMEETHDFKMILYKTQRFCNNSGSETQLVIQKSKWNEQFKITALDCAYMKLGELQFLNKILHDIRR
ncbi:galactose-3-O-sulfotransferase 2-like [Mercenaria mercenaria]|uniref:galactose-3-O-sulfotransferase 2-like n=1 Tax=Mercenaria mercenaria TaxID=6596 RepID=UPI00234EFF1C|nr:galactose-3-O-sulfotransferase 2-like [Mercenaria mercenaria]